MNKQSNVECHLPDSRKLIILSWLICLIVTLCYSYDFFIRAAPGVMETELLKAFHINNTQLGTLSAGYFLSYTIMQVPAGVILDKYNRRVVLSIAIALCVLGNYLFSATNNYDIAFLGRVLMGVGSAFGFLGAAKMAAMWLPSRFFTTFIGFTTVIGILGGLMTDTVLSNLTANLGWKTANGVFTYIGVVILALVVVFIRDNEKHVAKFNHISEANLKETVFNVLKIFKSYQFWIVSFVGAVLFIPLNVLGSLWGIGLIQAKFNITEQLASNMNSILFMGSAVGFAVSAIIASLTTRFRLMLVISVISLIVILFALLYISMDIKIFSVLFFLLGGVAGPQCVTFGIAKIIAPKGAAGSASGGVNMINNLIPVILLPLIGYILTHYGVKISSDSVIYTMASYQKALDMVIIMLIICIPMLMFLPKNYDINK